jgi:hypothetical protein
MSQLSLREASQHLARRASVTLAAVVLLAPVALYAQSVTALPTAGCMFA